MGVLAVRTQRLSMIGHHRNQRFIEEPVLPQLRKQLAQRGICVRDLAVVRLRRIALFEWRRRVVGVVRIVEVNPEKERRVFELTEPAERMVDDHAGAPFDGLVAIRTMAAKVEARVIDVKPAIEAGSGAVERVEDQRGHEGSGVVALLVEQVRQVRKARRNRDSEIVHVVELRVSTGEDRRVRSRRQRNMRERVRKDDAPTIGMSIAIQHRC